MTIAVLVMTDGRDDLLARTLDAWAPVFDHPLVSECWLHDDSGDDHRLQLRSWVKFGNRPAWSCLGAGSRRGFGGAIRRAWSRLRDVSAARYVLHLEDDVVPVRDVDLDAMVDVMDRNPHLVQMALRRQPWNDQERAAGGIVELHPEDYAEVGDGEHHWLEHRRHFATQPSIYRLSLCEQEWPAGRESEGHFGLALFGSDPSLRAAYWGTRDSGEWVEHVGVVRVGTGY